MTRSARSRSGASIARSRSIPPRDARLGRERVAPARLLVAGDSASSSASRNSTWWVTPERVEVVEHRPQRLEVLAAAHVGDDRRALDLRALVHEQLDERRGSSPAAGCRRRSSRRPRRRSSRSTCPAPENPVMTTRSSRCDCPNSGPSSRWRSCSRRSRRGSFSRRGRAPGGHAPIVPVRSGLPRHQAVSAGYTERMLERPRRYFPRLHWELIVCGVAGHELSASTRASCARGRARRARAPTACAGTAACAATPGCCCRAGRSRRRATPRPTATRSSCRCAARRCATRSCCGSSRSTARCTSSCSALLGGGRSCSSPRTASQLRARRSTQVVADLKRTAAARRRPRAPRHPRTSSTRLHDRVGAR